MILQACKPFFISIILTKIINLSIFIYLIWVESNNLNELKKLYAMVKLPRLKSFCGIEDESSQLHCFIILYNCKMDSVLREKLGQLNNKCQMLAKNGKYNECIEIMEEIVSIKKELYGMDHPEFQKSTDKLCEYLNLSAMIFLQKERFEQSLDQLRKAELVARNSLQFKSTTYNNLACYYRRTGKIRTALTYLIQALELELKIQQPKTLADTHLNLCAVLSQLDRHQDALQHVMLSIILLQDEFLQVTLPIAKQTGGEVSDERLAVLAIAYHNLGVEFEHLKRFEESVKIYRKALKISKDYLSDNEQLIQNLTKVVNSATGNIEDQKRSALESRRTKHDRQFSESKKEIYKDLARHADRLKNLPKLRVSKDNQMHSSVEPMQKVDKTHSQYERSFQSRKHPRYYKSYAMTPSNDESSVAEVSLTGQQVVRTRIPVSEGLQDFSGK